MKKMAYMIAIVTCIGLSTPAQSSGDGMLPGEDMALDMVPKGMDIFVAELGNCVRIAGRGAQTACVSLGNWLNRTLMGHPKGDEIDSTPIPVRDQNHEKEE